MPAHCVMARQPPLPHLLSPAWTHAQQPTNQPTNPHTHTQPTNRIYSDGLSKDSKQSFISWLVAITTLTLYTGWMHILIGLFIACFFSSTARYLTLAIWLTVLLPPKPVLWNAFCRCGRGVWWSVHAALMWPVQPRENRHGRVSVAAGCLVACSGIGEAFHYWAAHTEACGMLIR